MSTIHDEVEILEGVASHRTKVGANPGTLTLTNKQLTYQPDRKYSVITTLYFAAVCLFFGIAFFVASVATLYIPGGPPFFLTLAMGILLTVPGVALVVVAWLRRKSKEIVMDLNTIKYVSETGRSDIVIMLEGDRKERFYMPKREAKEVFLDEVKFALKGDPVAVPSSLVVSEDVDVPKYSVPSKYPGAVVRLQKNYLTPKVCCMCGEPAQEKTVTAKSARRERTKQGVPYFSPLSRIRNPFTHPFPICDNCFSVRRRAVIAGSVGGAVGLFIGGAVFVLFFLSGLLIPVLDFVGKFLSAFSLLEYNILTLLVMFLVTATIFAAFGWGIAHVLSVSFALRKVPRDKKAFFEAVAENEGIRVARRPGFVAFGFLSKEFAKVFGQMNSGISTAVEQENRKTKKKK